MDIQIIPALAQEKDLYILGHLFLNVFDDNLGILVF